METRPHVLIVGAGAVGQVYGRHLALGGARVSVFVRPKPNDQHPDGFTLYPLRARGRFEPARFCPERVFTSLDDVARERWDQVWNCVPTTALVRPWIDDVVVASGDATLVLFPAGVDVVERLGASLPEDRLVVGIPGMLSYFAPMEGETVSAPGVAYWFPPLSPTSLAGKNTARRDAVVAALRRGRCPAVARASVRELSAFGSAVLIPHIVALEGAAWSYRAFAAGHWLADSVASTREALAAAAVHLGVGRPFLARVLRPWTIRLVLWTARAVAPLDLGVFFKTHFTKLRTQTEVQIAEYIDLGTKSGGSVDALARLSCAVFGEGWKKRLPARP